MDEYLSEKEQIERIRLWLRENGLFLLAGVGLGLLALFGFNRYEAYVTNRGEAAAALWISAQQAVQQSRIDEAEAALAELKEKHASSGYTDNAALLLASALLDNEPAAAAAELRYVMESTDDPNTAMIARERLARVLAYDERYDEALALLDVDEPGAFAARFKEIEADTHYARGAFDEARRAYVDAMQAEGSDLVDRQFVQVKLNEVISALEQGEAGGAASVPGGAQPAGDAGAAEPPDPATPAEPADESDTEQQPAGVESEAAQGAPENAAEASQ